MLEKDILKVSLSHLDALGLKEQDKPKSYQYSNTVKSIINDLSAHRELSFISSKLFQIKISASDYKSAIFNDLYFGDIRIKEQCKNLQHLLDSQAKPAWTLVTAYYAAYFMASDISKANGKFVTNLSEDEFKRLLSNEPLSFQDTVKVESNNPFFLSVEHGEMTGDITLIFRRSSPKPHKIAWHNFSQITDKINITDERLTYLTLLKSIISSGSSGWQTPSAVRNTWNYSQANYFGEKGDDVGRTFSSIIRSPKSTFNWARNNNLKPSNENLAASIAYVYHTLRPSHQALINRLKIN